MATTTPYQEAKQSLRQLYLDDPRRWLVSFSGGKDRTMVASLPREFLTTEEAIGRRITAARRTLEVRDTNGEPLQVVFSLCRPAEMKLSRAS